MLMEVEGLDCAEYEYSPRNVHKQMRGVSAPRPRRTAGAPEPAFICGDLAACEFEPANDAGLHRRFADAYPALGYAYLRGYDIAIRADGRGAAAIAVASHGGVVSPRAAALGGARAAPRRRPRSRRRRCRRARRPRCRSTTSSSARTCASAKSSARSRTSTARPSTTRPSTSAPATPNGCRQRCRRAFPLRKRTRTSRAASARRPSTSSSHARASPAPNRSWTRSEPSTRRSSRAAHAP
mmetsp:Transcript_26581/g.94827  ORF Transcript_26581/g.94827 Transcript_26581/m.94827 type:complete len:239 (+) Transcript_26581:237-953(+)